MAQDAAPPVTSLPPPSLPPPLPQDAPAPDALDGDVLPMSPVGDIPPHVWALLQQAGELAAEKLVAILQSPRFASYAPTAQRALIELALTRAYGLPIRRALNVNLSSSDSDAVAHSLADLAGALPETAPRAPAFRAGARLDPSDDTP